MLEEKAGAEKQNSKNGFEKNEHACSVEGVLWVMDCTARPYLKVPGQTWKIQSLSKHQESRFVSCQYMRRWEHNPSA